MKAVWVTNQEGQGVPYAEQELRCILSSRLEGLPLRGSVEAGHHCPERSYPLHSQGDAQKAEGFFSLGLQQDVWVRETEEGLAGVETDGT